MVTSFTDTGAVAAVTLDSVLLVTLTLFRTAGSKSPLGTREMTEASVESGITQARSVGAVAPSIIGTITLLVALLPIEAFRTTVLAQVSTHTRRTAAVSVDGVTAGTIFTLAGEGAVFAKMSLSARLIADNARPPVGAIAAIFPQIAFSSIRTVVARQTAVAAESVIQAHKFFR